LKPSTTAKLAAAAVVLLLFGGFALRAAMRLVSTATHSLFFGVLLLVMVVWIFSHRKYPCHSRASPAQIVWQTRGVQN
jgi:hypothetical protein